MKTKKLGWIPDLPDHRDYGMESKRIGARQQTAGEEKSIDDLLNTVGVTNLKTSLPKKVDLRGNFSPVEDQENIGSCTAHAAVGLMEYFEITAHGTYTNASRLFVYKATRNMLHWTSDDGAFLRTTMGALALFGSPPEEYWPYDTSKFNDEPPAFCYAYASNFQAISYYRLDDGVAKKELLQRIKRNIAHKLPSMFGFAVYGSMYNSLNPGEIPFPSEYDRQRGGHAVVCAGYDDAKVIEHPRTGQQTKGALLIRNSWGIGWGEGGYGWLPYEYVLQGLAVDWWSLIKSEWVDTGNFSM